jgi:hypothetical protein
MVEHARELLKAAMQSEHKLKQYLVMSPEQWATESKDTKKKKWWEVLGIAQPALSGNVATKLSTLREIFTSPYMSRSGTLWLKHLLAGKVQCEACCQQNLKEGVLECSIDKVGRHLENKSHKKMAKQLKENAARRIDMHRQGVQPAAVIKAKRSAAHVAAALVVGSFAAGTHGAAGVPPTSIPRLLNRDMLGLLKYELLNGIPSASTITSDTLPLAVELVEERIKKMVEGQPLSMYIDGGSSDLADGRKVVVVCASSLDERIGTVVLDVMVMESHETSDTQMEQIEALVEKYHILPENVHYLCADNAGPNKLTVDKLNEKGYNIIYARCLPHCLNLIVKAFMNAMDKEFKLCTNLKLMRHFLTAGGGVARKLIALEYGFVISGVDFCDTRWASLVHAILYIANKQTPGHLKLAKERLQELAAQGDDTAQEALDNPAPPQVIFNVLHDFVEGVLEEHLERRREMDNVDAAEASLPEAKRKLLRFFSRQENYMAFQLIDVILGGDVGDKTEKLTTLFTITQGNPAFAARLKSSVTGEVPNAVQATRNLLRRLKGLHYRWKGADADVGVGTLAEQTEKKNVKGRLQRVFDELRLRAGQQAEDVVKSCKDNGHDILDSDEPFNEQRAANWIVEQADTYTSKVQPKLEAALAAAVLAVDEAAGLVKTEECVSGLEESQVFDMNKQPRDFGVDDEVLKHLAFTGNYPATENVVEEWREYVCHWRAPPAVMSPTDVYAAWKAKVASMPTLAPHAMRQFSRPISSAACERVFSFLEHMDRSDRRRMKKETLRLLLFLRGNQEILNQLVEEVNAARVGAEVGENRAKRARNQ